MKVKSYFLLQFSIIEIEILMTVFFLLNIAYISFHNHWCLFKSKLNLTQNQLFICSLISLFAYLLHLKIWFLPHVYFILLYLISVNILMIIDTPFVTFFSFWNFQSYLTLSLSSLLLLSPFLCISHLISSSHLPSSLPFSALFSSLPSSSLFSTTLFSSLLSSHFDVPFFLSYSTSHLLPFFSPLSCLISVCSQAKKGPCCGRTECQSVHLPIFWFKIDRSNFHGFQSQRADQLMSRPVKQCPRNSR